MKRLVFAVLVAAFVGVSTADATYYGTLQAKVAYTLSVGPDTTAGCAVTALLVTKSGRIDVDYVLTVTDGVNEDHTIPPNVVRLVIEYDCGFGNATVVLVRQNGVNVGQEQKQEGRMVFDVI